MKRATLLLYFGSAILLLLVLLLLLGLNMRRGLNHDEEQFIASGQLIATVGALPYVDFPYFHVPGLSLIYAAIFRFSPYLLLSARLFSVLCAWLMIGLLFSITLIELRSQAIWVRLGTAIGLVLLLMGSPIFVYTSGRAWNHDLPMLLTVGALWLLMRAARPRAWLLCGLLLGLATATRLSFAFAALAVVIALLVQPQLRWAQRAHSLRWLAFGGLLGAMPALVFLIWAPQAFLFGNLTYIGLNTEYYRSLADPPASMTLLGKVDFIIELVRSEPANLLVWICLATGIGFFWRVRHRGATPPALPTLALVMLAMFASALVATPLQAQYFYPLWPLAILGLARVLGAASRWAHLSKVALALLGVSLLACVLSTPPYRAGLEVVFWPDEWYPIKLHARGEWVKTLIKQGDVLTVAPIIPLEGRLSIYPELATGPFAWRVAPLLPAAARRRYQLFTPDELLEQLATAPPRALLVGLDNDDAAAEQTLVMWAQQHGYMSLPLPDEGMLWVSPLATWDDAIRLGAHTLPTHAVHPGASINVVFYLQNIRPIPQNLNILVRILAPDDHEVWRAEGWPWGAATANWQPGEIWPDGHQITLPADVTPGCYRVEIGFYDPATFTPLGNASIVGSLWVTSPTADSNRDKNGDPDGACPYLLPASIKPNA